MRTYLFIIVTFVLVSLVGCQSSEVYVTKGLEQLDAANIVSITLKINGSQAVMLTDASSIKKFVQAITSSEYSISQLDIAAPSYGATATMKDGTHHQFSFWIDRDSSGIFIKSEQDGHYRLPEAAKQDLLDLFQSLSK